ncbi:cardiolipin synthase ClsB [Marinobacter salicampi]|uniref:cardiolipin synthase ClsB n=1 Tax=Marinobacter salicampi TaxID=435907 RepID=UPI00140C335E|nr:cardiolipin synthase ClsB [Marinobacter salicampi]
MSKELVEGNAISLMTNGDEFFARALEMVRAARQEVLIETFMVIDDSVGRELQEALIAAAKRGVWISVLADGYGTHFLPEGFIQEMERVGIHFCLYHPQPRWLRVRANIFKRLHRKILVVDGHTAFIGGINYEADHLSRFGAESKQDYAAELTGPIVDEIHLFAREAIQEYSGGRLRFVELVKEKASKAGGQNAAMRFVARDNRSHRNSIENAYLARISAAEHRIVIANCYFFPGYRVLRALRNAARRGVEVTILTQGRPDSRLARAAGSLLYDFLVESDIQVFEYWERQLHAKIAAFDDEWATIGSSNLDPLSLSLNLEANVFVQDGAFNSRIRKAIGELIYGSEVVLINDSWWKRRTLLKGFISFLVYHFLRHLPGFTAWVPKLERRSSSFRSRHPSGPSGPDECSPHE